MLHRTVCPMLTFRAEQAKVEVFALANAACTVMKLADPGLRWKYPITSVFLALVSTSLNTASPSRSELGFTTCPSARNVSARQSQSSLVGLPNRSKQFAVHSNGTPACTESTQTG